MTTQKESRRGQTGGGGKAGQAIGEAPSSPIIPQSAKAATPKHGRIEGNVWRKTAQGSRHQLRRPSAWCVDVDDLEAAEALGVAWLEIRDVESGITWAAPLSAFREHGVEISRGYGRQVALPLHFWARRKAGETSAEAFQQLQLALTPGRGGRK